MANKFAYAQLGEFVVKFQLIENQIRELIIYIVGHREDFIEILISELEFSGQVSKCDVIFSRFCDTLPVPESGVKEQFHLLMNKVLKAAERRNELVHSTYFTWQNIHGETGLLRQSYKNRASKGVLEMREEELLPSDLVNDITKLEKISEEIEKFRLRVVSWKSDAWPA